MAGERKSFPLRIDASLFEELRAWAEQEMRSVNGQIEFLLAQSVRARRKNSVQQSESIAEQGRSENSDSGNE